MKKTEILTLSKRNWWWLETSHSGRRRKERRADYAQTTSRRLEKKEKQKYNELSSLLTRTRTRAYPCYHCAFMTTRGSMHTCDATISFFHQLLASSSIVPPQQTIGLLDGVPSSDEPKLQPLQKIGFVPEHSFTNLGLPSSHYSHARSNYFGDPLLD